jgi:hypothetical protein
MVVLSVYIRISTHTTGCNGMGLDSLPNTAIGDTSQCATLPCVNIFSYVMLLRVRISVNIMLLGISVLKQEISKETLRQKRLHYISQHITCRWEVQVCVCVSAGASVWMYVTYLCVYVC